MAVAGSVTYSMRSYFSSHYLYSAQRLSQEAGRIEAQAPPGLSFDPDHRMFVTSSVLASVTFLEALVNEVFQDVVDRHDQHDDAYVAPLGDETKRIMSWLWAPGGAERLPILDKFDAALVAAGLVPFDKGAYPYQYTALVVEVRNALVHYKPQSLGPARHHKLAARLRSKFAPNKLMEGAGNPFFPDHALGHGCSEWAWRSCRDHADEFSRRLGIRPHYQRIASQRSDDDAASAAPEHPSDPSAPPA